MIFIGHQGVFMLLQEKPHFSGRGRIAKVNSVFNYLIEVKELNHLQRPPDLFPGSPKGRTVQNIHKSPFQAGYLNPEDGSTYLGDILLSVSQAQEQAQSRGHSLADEIQLLVVHGALHLLGYDHTEPEEKTRMWVTQGEILAQLGVSASVLDQANSPSTHV